MAQTKTSASTKTARSKTTAKASAKKPAKAAAKAPAKKATKPAARKTKAASKAGEEEVKLDRRRAATRRKETKAEAKAEKAVEAKPAKAKAAQPPLERREKVNRRRQIDPTTCERDYSDAEVEFMNALDAYKRTSGRMFPTCSEVLEVVRGMGYVQLSPVELSSLKAERGETDQAAPESLEETAEADALDALADSDELHVD